MTAVQHNTTLELKTVVSGHYLKSIFYFITCANRVCLLPYYNIIYYDTVSIHGYA